MIANELPGIARKTPGILRLVTSETLAGLVHEQHIIKIQIAAAVEAAMRLWLYCGFANNRDDDSEKTACEKALSGLLIPSTRDAFQAWVNDQSRIRSYQFLDPFLPADFSINLHKILVEWKNADGVSAFVCRNGKSYLPLSDCTLLPFFLQYGDRTGAYTGDGRPIPNLEKGIETAYRIAERENYGGISKRITVKFSTLKGDCSNYLCGESLGLAVLTALTLKHYKVSSPMECLASGVLDGFTLDPCAPDIYQKKLRAFLQTGAKNIFLPECGINIPCNEKVIFLKQDYLSFFRTKMASLTKRHIDDIQQEVDKTGSAIQRCQISYPDAEEKLLILLQEIDRQDKSQKHLVAQARAKLHLGAVYCHLGRPDCAEKYLTEVLESGLPSTDIALALIRYAVVQTDLCRFEEALRISESAMQKICGRDIDKDLKMRCYGTRGQARMYQALNIHDPSQRVKAFNDCLVDLKEAYANAELPEDKAQDACYIFLAHALHSPDSITPQMIEETEHLCATTNSNRFFLRAQWLAPYRAMLLGIPDVCRPASDVPHLETGLEWVYATALKYRGSLFAAEGCCDKAIGDFKTAAAALPQRPDLIGMIRISVLLQAAESLLSDRPQEALTYLNEIREVFKNEAYGAMLAGPVQGKRWLQRAHTLIEMGCVPTNSDNHPQLRFPY